MEFKNIFEPAVKEEIITRINKLTPGTQRKWGKMDVAQMLAHSQKPIAVATGQMEMKGNAFIRAIASMFKKQLFNDKPFKQKLPTSKSFLIADTRDFVKEKEQLTQLIRSFSEEALAIKTHPVFGSMTTEQWGVSNWKHLDHHLQQFGV